MMKRNVSALSRKVFMVGGSITQFTGKGHPDFIHKKHPDFGKKENPTLEELITKSTNDALDATKVDPEIVDRIAIGNFCGELFSSQGHLGAAVIGANPKFLHKQSMRVEGACASGSLAVQAARENILAGADIALAVGAEVQTTVSARTGGDYLARASHYARQRSLDDFTFPCVFARRMKHIQEAGHFTMEDAAKVAVKAYENGNKNPLAHMSKASMPLERANNASDKNPNFLSNPEYKDYLRVSDCSQVSDGACSILLASEEGIKKIGNPDLKVVEIKTMQVATGNLYEDPQDFTRMFVSAAACAKAYEATGLTPKDLQVAEVHDCFTIAELLMYEALGIAEYGKAKDMINDGSTRIDGRIPVNCGGGLIAFGHPVGATGVKQIFEVYRQMKGLCGDYQIKNFPTIGATINMGGDDKTAVCSIIQNC